MGSRGQSRNSLARTSKRIRALTPNSEPQKRLAALVDDLLGVAVAGADDLALGLRVQVYDIQAELVDAVLFDLGVYLGLELVAGLSHRLRRGRTHEAQHHHRHDDSEHEVSLSSL